MITKAVDAMPGLRQSSQWARRQRLTHGRSPVAEPPRVADQGAGREVPEARGRRCLCYRSIPTTFEPSRSPCSLFEPPQFRAGIRRARMVERGDFGGNEPRKPLCGRSGSGPLVVALRGSLSAFYPSLTSAKSIQLCSASRADPERDTSPGPFDAWPGSNHRFLVVHP